MNDIFSFTDSRTLPGRRKDSIFTVEDIEDEDITIDEGDDDVHSLGGDYKDLPMYRKSTLRLKERMDKQLVQGDKREFECVCLQSIFECVRVCVCVCVCVWQMV